MHIKQLLMSWLGGRSPESAAPSLGVVPNTLRNWLSGASVPPASKLPGLSAATGLPLGVLAKAVQRGRSARRMTRGKHARLSRKGA